MLMVQVTYETHMDDEVCFTIVLKTTPPGKVHIVPEALITGIISCFMCKKKEKG